MMMLKRAAFGFAAGGVSAFLVDLKAWDASGSLNYQWRVMAKHVIIGAVSGASTAVGLTAGGF